MYNVLVLQYNCTACFYNTLLEYLLLCEWSVLLYSVLCCTSSIYLEQETVLQTVLLARK
jgi:hypothetical protein